MLERLKQIPGVILIANNPTIELWFLLHYKNQICEIKEEECIRQLSNRIHINYQKGVIDVRMQFRLREKCIDACNRSKLLNLYVNPSTNMHIFVESLEKAKNEK